MAKPTDYIVERYYQIINQLQQKPHKIKELQSKFFNKISERQIRNNIDEIRNNYKIDIKKDKKGNYWIEDISEKSQKYVEMFSMIHFSIKLFEDEQNSNFVQLERANFIQQNHFDELIDACKNRKIISFKYTDFWWGEREYVVKPYFLKQFRNRWYLIARITKISGEKEELHQKRENQMYNFSLDRFSDNTQITDIKQTFTDNIEANDFYQDCFGIIKPYTYENQEPEELILCFEEIQGRYVEKLPLHKSQEVFEKTETHIFMRFKVHISYDFVQEILHFGENVKVIAPQHLKNTMAHLNVQIGTYYDENDALPFRSEIY